MDKSMNFCVERDGWMWSVYKTYDHNPVLKTKIGPRYFKRSSAELAMLTLGNAYVNGKLEKHTDLTYQLHSTERKVWTLQAKNKELQTFVNNLFGSQAF